MEISPDAMAVDTNEPKIRLRSYQQEMLDASLKRNVIVAMDTGSGKTAVAIFRILAELERTDSSKLVWFIAPKVELSRQQYHVLSQHLPGYLVKILLGEDGVDKWTDQKLWDATLTNVRVVVSTPAVLADALTHGFVHISRMSLLVFDEAHHVRGKSPMNRIMRNFYHPAKAQLGATPHILGLSASPVINSNPQSLQEIERSLDAIPITPNQHRSDLESYMHPPEVQRLEYAAAPTYSADEVPFCTALLHALQTYDIRTDPYVVELQELMDSGDTKAAKNLEKVQLKRKTWCLDQLSTLLRKSRALQDQLGASAAEWYISECRRRFGGDIEPGLLSFTDVSERERIHLHRIFKELKPTQSTDLEELIDDDMAITPKVRLLVDLLQHQHSTHSSSLRILIFVEQRAVVLSLGRLLRLTKELKHSYCFGTFLGSSVSDRRATKVSDLVDLKAQSQDLDSFRGSGKVNVLIATSVLEEGIDISACNLVICFDPSMTMIQYVQRRGRARHRDSKYVMMTPEGDISSDSRWSRLEKEMKEAYKDEKREVGSLIQKDVEHHRVFRVDSTGALLQLDNAKAHLYHFCQVSTQGQTYVDVRPEFTTEQDKEDRWTATVNLPSFVHASLRSANGRDKWLKEENAIKDAAYESYILLHQAGLVNDNLLPLTRDYGPNPGQMHVDQPSIVPVSGRLSSWSKLCHKAKEPNVRWICNTIRLFGDDGTELVNLEMLLPSAVSISQPLVLHWNQSTRYEVMVRTSEQRECLHRTDANLEAWSSTTDLLLRSVYSSRMDSTMSALPFFISNSDLQHAAFSGKDAAEAIHLLGKENVRVDCGLIRIKGETGWGYFLSGIEPSDDGPMAILTAFPKRRDFLHRPHNGDEHAAYTAKQRISLDRCTVDALPARYCLFAAFLPSILHRLDTTMLAADLQNTLLASVPIRDPTLLIEAISSPSAQETADYNRLEFLGDSVLKFCAVLHVMAKHPTWPEGYLGLEKFRIVSNNQLAKAGLDAGLDKYILTKPFTGSKWRPLYINEMLNVDTGSRDMSSKVLADVIEALIGASFLDGGLEKGYECIKVLLPAEGWIPLPECIATVTAESVHGRHVDLGLLERLVGHHFKTPELLIEALTHASFPHTAGGSSYERLEFLGDAVLDLIAVPRLFRHHRKPRHYDLHRMRDALANGNFLAYCCMQLSVREDRFDVVSQKNEFGVQQSERAVCLHDFLRAGSQLTKAKRQCLEQSESHLAAIKHSLEHGSQYPWPELIAFKPPKFFSDIVESTLGALYLDSAGDLRACENFLDKLGIFAEMRRILDDHVETAYPKEQLGILADKSSVDYVCKSTVTEEGIELFECTALVGEESVATVEGLRSKEEAELRAARKAVIVLQGRVETNGGRKRKLEVAMRDQHAQMGASENEQDETMSDDL